jgi:DNA invertase Pin-like site-specific DNA recombinase
MYADKRGKIIMKYGYSRVSSSSQCLQSQTDWLISQGVDEKYIREEKVSGIKHREKLERLYDETESGDDLYAVSFCRFARSAKDLLEIVEKFNAKGVKIITKSFGTIDISTTTGKLTMQLLAALAEMERNLISERTKAGLESARKKGNFGGRKATDKQKIDTAFALYDNNKNDYSVATICAMSGITKPTFYKYLRLRKEQEVQNENNG